jgi:hypothetical protein
MKSEIPTDNITNKNNFNTVRVLLNGGIQTHTPFYRILLFLILMEFNITFTELKIMQSSATAGRMTPAAAAGRAAIL